MAPYVLQLKNRILPCSLAFALLGLPALASGQASTLNGTSLSGAPEGSLSSALPESTRLVTDVFVGRGVNGPYVLSWRLFESGTEHVSRDGVLLSAGPDYKLDQKTGTLTFIVPLKSQQIARVDYRCTPDRALANSAAMLAPMQFNLFDRGNGALSFNALFRPDTAASQTATGVTPAGLMILGFNGNAKLSSQSGLTSKLFVDASGGNLLDKSGLQVAEKSKTSFGLFSAGFTRGGSGFKAPDESGIAAARQVIDAQGSLNPIHGIAASATFQQASDLSAVGKGQVITTLGQKINATLGATTKLIASRTDVFTLAPDGTSVDRLTNHFQLDQQFGKTTRASAVIDHVGTDAGDSHAVTQTSSLQVRTQPIEQVTVSGSFQNRLGATGAEDASNLRVEATPTQTVKLSALLGERYNQTSARHQREATVDYAMFKSLSLTGVVKMSSEAGSESISRGISATAKPIQFVEVAGGFRLRDATLNGLPDPAAADTYDVKLSVGLPKSLLKVTGGYSCNPEDDHGTVARAHSGQLAIQSTLGQFDLGGGYQRLEDYTSSKFNSVFDLRFGWRITRATQITTSYRETQTLDQGLLLADTYSLSLSHRVGSLFDMSLSGAMTQQQKDGMLTPIPDYRADLKLGLKF